MTGMIRLPLSYVCAGVWLGVLLALSACQLTQPVDQRADMLHTHWQGFGTWR